jgi:hypothetical protein
MIIVTVVGIIDAIPVAITIVCVTVIIAIENSQPRQ